MKHLFVVCFLYFFNICYSQLPDYYVYLVKGSVTVSNQKGKSEIKQGGFLYKKDVLSFGNNSEITLTNKDADYFVLNSGNNVKLNELATKDAKSYTGITKKYLNLVWDEVLDPNYDFTKFKSKNLTGVYGGVSRGEACKNLIFPVNGLKTSEDTLNFKWLATSASGNYNFFIYDGEGKEILNKPIKDTQTIISITEQKFAPGKYYWLIKSNDGNCEDEVPLYFEILTKEDEQRFIHSIIPADDLMSLAAELEVIDKLEKNAFIYTAKKNYEEASATNTGNKALQHMYVMFLLNYGFNNEAAKAWNTK